MHHCNTKAARYADIVCGSPSVQHCRYRVIDRRIAPGCNARKRQSYINRSLYVLSCMYY